MEVTSSSLVSPTTGAATVRLPLFVLGLSYGAFSFSDVVLLSSDMPGLPSRTYVSLALQNECALSSVWRNF